MSWLSRDESHSDIWDAILDWRPKISKFFFAIVNFYLKQPPKKRTV